MCVHLPGIIATATLEFRSGTIFVTNIYIFGISAPQAQHLSKKIAAYTSKADSDVTGRSVAFLCGDFSFAEANDPPTRTSCDEHVTTRSDEPPQHKYLRKHWSEVTCSLTELHQPEHTRIGTPQILLMTNTSTHHASTAFTPHGSHGS